MTASKPDIASAVLAILNRVAPGLDICLCDNCRAIRKRACDDNWRCETCGFSGRPTTIPCACYDHVCSSAGARGQGCFHGDLTCPVCDYGEGDVDPWSIIREVRELLLLQE